MARDESTIVINYESNIAEIVDKIDELEAALKRVAKITKEINSMRLFVNTKAGKPTKKK